MLRLLTLSLAATFFALAGWSYSAAKGTKKEKEDEKTVKPVDDFYPLQVGNQWHYRVEAGGNSVEAVSKIAKIEFIDNAFLARLESTVNSKVVGTENLRVTSKGVFRYFNNGQRINPAVCLLKYPAKSGDKWGGKISVGEEQGKYSCDAEEENVEVPAGKFKAMKVNMSMETGEQSVIIAYWFVKDVGFVKQTIEAGNLNITIELEKFEPAKDAPK
jgi:hypothetical protein